MMVNLRGQYAGFVTRLFAFAIDNIIISLMIFLGGWIIRTTAEMVKFETLLNSPYALMDILRSITAFLTSPPVLAGATGLFFFTYHLFFLILVGATPGKAIFGVRVIELRGRPLGFSRAAVRILGYVPSTVVLFIGFLWIIIDNRRQAWHDKLAGTCVIYSWDARPEERFLAVPIKRMKLLSSVDSDELND